MPAIGGLEPGWGLTVLRVAMGLVFAIHGYAKFAAGLGKASAFFAKVSIPLPELTGPVIAVLELVGGILLVLGQAECHQPVRGPQSRVPSARVRGSTPWRRTQRPCPGPQQTSRSRG